MEIYTVPAAEAPVAERDWSQVPNPVAADAASIARGRALYEGRGLCYVCHGRFGDGYGPVRKEFVPKPNAFFEPEWGDSFTDGELMGVLTLGKFGTAMLSFVPMFIAEEEGWDVINYLRTFRGKSSVAYEEALVADDPDAPSEAPDGASGSILEGDAP